MHARRYFNDTWTYDLDELKWVLVGRPGGNAPSPRGGCQLAVHGSKLFLYGGHTVLVDKSDRSERDVVHDDLWCLDLESFQARQLCKPHTVPVKSPDVPCVIDTSIFTCMQWERLKRAGLAPSKRASFGMVTHRDRALLFGGVTDRAGAGAKEMDSHSYALCAPTEHTALLQV